mmetsp:Transcript_9952/g.19313  ORF Transcript_9952/g.19313 Transcript_9952/m.19313 type:complete len:200 (+) Transcript_9952:343-942(+)
MLVKKDRAENFFKTTLCKLFLRGNCPDGDRCTHAHGVDEQRTCPDLFKTKLCKGWLRGTCREQNCSYAHGNQELRVTSEFYKTRICKHWLVGRCLAGDTCRHAHGVTDLRPLTNTAIGRLKDRHSYRVAMNLYVPASEVPPGGDQGPKPGPNQQQNARTARNKGGKNGGGATNATEYSVPDPYSFAQIIQKDPSLAAQE